MIVRKVRHQREFGFAREIPATKLPPEVLAQRWESCPKDMAKMESWCDCVFKEEEQIRVACKTKPWSCCPFGICPPWSPPWGEYGAGCRYIPFPKPSFLYGVGVSTDAVSLVGLAADPLQKDQIRALEKKQAEAASLQQKQALQYQIELEKKRAVAKKVTNVAVAAGATGVAFVILATIAKRRRSNP